MLGIFGNTLSLCFQTFLCLRRLIWAYIIWACTFWRHIVRTLSRPFDIFHTPTKIRHRCVSTVSFYLQYPNRLSKYKLRASGTCFTAKISFVISLVPYSWPGIYIVIVQIALREGSSICTIQTGSEAWKRTSLSAIGLVMGPFSGGFREFEIMTAMLVMASRNVFR